MTEAFAALELAGWQEVPDAYDAGFARLTRSPRRSLSRGSPRHEQRPAVETR